MASMGELPDSNLAQMQVVFRRMPKIVSKRDEIVQLLHQLKRQSQGHQPFSLDVRVLPVVLVELATREVTGAHPFRV
jgi:hypothetical protein